MIVGMAFIGMEIKRNETNNRQVVPNGDRVAAIVESFEDEAGVELLNDSQTGDDETLERILPTLRLAKNKMIPPRSERPIMVPTTEGSTSMIESLLLKTDESRPSVAGGIVETLPSKPSCTMGVNTLKVV